MMPWPAEKHFMYYDSNVMVYHARLLVQAPAAAEKLGRAADLKTSRRHTHTDTQTQTHTHRYTDADTHTDTHTQTNTHTHTHTDTHTHVDGRKATGPAIGPGTSAAAGGVSMELGDEDDDADEESTTSATWPAELQNKDSARTCTP